MATAEYELYTDLEPALAERAAQLLAQSLSGLNAMFARAPVVAPQKLTVIALADSLEFERRYGARSWGVAFSDAAGTTLYLYGPPDRWFVRAEATYEGTESVLQHELAHAVLRRYFPQQPRWFAEGMAKYLETYRWLDPQTLRLGEPNLQAYRDYRAIRSLSVQEMVAWQSMNERDLKVAGLYALSWAFVHYARNKEPQQLGRYMATLAQEGPERAWAATFAGREEALDKAVFGYLKQGDYLQYTLKVPVPPPAVARLEPVEGEQYAGVVARLDQLEAAMKSAP